jgi:hypothetical protein
MLRQEKWNAVPAHSSGEVQCNDCVFEERDDWNCCLWWYMFKTSRYSLDKITHMFWLVFKTSRYSLDKITHMFWLSDSICCSPNQFWWQPVRCGCGWCLVIRKDFISYKIYMAISVMLLEAIVQLMTICEYINLTEQFSCDIYLAASFDKLFYDCLPTLCH